MGKTGKDFAITVAGAIKIQEETLEIIVTSRKQVNKSCIQDYDGAFLEVGDELTEGSVA